MEINKLDWSRDLLNYGRARPMYNSKIHNKLIEILSISNVKEIDIIPSFFEKFDSWIQTSHHNKLIGLDSFKKRQLIKGVTHSLDDLHVRFSQKIVILPKDYKYHLRINPNQRILPYLEWKEGDVAVISYPFSYTGGIPPNWEMIIRHCEKNNIPIHIDAAWYGICRDLKIDLDRGPIQSVSFSLSKCLGLGNYPIGVRYCKNTWSGPVETVNNFNYTCPLLLHIGMSFMEDFKIDFFQETYEEAYKVVIKYFNLLPSHSIHIALDENDSGELVPVGIRGFLREIVEGKFK